MSDLTREEYARLRLKAKHGTLTAEEQAALFERMASQSDAGSDARPSQTLCKPPMRCRIEASHRR